MILLASISNVLRDGGFVESPVTVPVLQPGSLTPSRDDQRERFVRLCTVADGTVRWWVVPSGRNDGSVDAALALRRDTERNASEIVFVGCDVSLLSSADTFLPHALVAWAMYDAPRPHLYQAAPDLTDAEMTVLAEMQFVRDFESAKSSLQVTTPVLVDLVQRLDLLGDDERPAADAAPAATVPVHVPSAEPAGAALHALFPGDDQMRIIGPVVDQDDVYVVQFLDGTQSRVGADAIPEHILLPHRKQEAPEPTALRGDVVAEDTVQLATREKRGRGTETADEPEPADGKPTVTQDDRVVEVLWYGGGCVHDCHPGSLVRVMTDDDRFCWATEAFLRDRWPKVLREFKGADPKDDKGRRRKRRRKRRRENA